MKFPATLPIPSNDPVRVRSPRASALAASIVLAALSQGCASAVWHPRVESVAGEYKNVEAISAKADDSPEGTAEDVKALVMTLPPGMSLEGDVLRVDADRYEVLGKVAAKPAGEFFYPYRESWRRPVCYPQRVLVVATLFVWMAVPTVWPCFISSGSVDDRRDRIVEAMRRATKELGGNMVLVAGFGGQVTIAKTSSSSAVVSTTEAIEGVGWAIRVKSAPAASPPVAPAVAAAGASSL